MAKLGTRSAIAGVVAAMLLSSACAPAVRSDGPWHELAEAAREDRGVAVDGTRAEGERPAGLAYAADEDRTSAPDAGTDAIEDPAPMPPPRRPADEDAGRAASRIAVGTAADWSAYERAIVANLAPGGSTPPAPVLAAFERASLVVCAGVATPRTAAADEGLDADAERALNVFTPAMCYLAPSEAGGLPGPAVDVDDWKTLIDLRWRAGAGWIGLEEFEARARRACLGLGIDADMAQSSLDQIDALVAHGECALQWNR